jgi:hypothetical protein
MLLSMISAVVLAASPTPADQQIAERAALKPADAPRHWTVPKQRPSAEEGSPCPELTSSRTGATGAARARSFENGDFVAVSTAVYIYADEATAKRRLRAMSARRTIRCYAESVTDAFEEEEQLAVGDVTRSSFKLEPVGDQRAGRRVTLEVDAGLVGEIDVNLELVFVRVGRGLALGFFVDALGPVDKTVRRDLTAKQVDRLQAALSRRPPARRAARAGVASGG